MSEFSEVGGERRWVMYRHLSPFPFAFQINLQQPLFALHRTGVPYFLAPCWYRVILITKPGSGVWGKNTDTRTPGTLPKPDGSLSPQNTTIPFRGMLVPISLRLVKQFTLLLWVGTNARITLLPSRGLRYEASKLRDTVLIEPSSSVSATPIGRNPRSSAPKDNKTPQIAMVLFFMFFSFCGLQSGTGNYWVGLKAARTLPHR